MAGNKNSGRDLETTESLPKNWKEEIEREYKLGASDVEIKSMIKGWRGKFSNDLWDRWIRDEPIFSEIVKGGKIDSEAWWNRMGRLNLMVEDGAPKMNYTGWYMQMKNRFGWADKQEQPLAIPETTKVTLNIDA